MRNFLKRNKGLIFLSLTIYVSKKIYFNNLEIMPFTERERFILTNEKFENELGKIISQRIQGSAPILPKEHEVIFN